MCMWVRVPTEVTEPSDAPEMELQAVVSHMGAGDQPQFLWKGSKHSVSWSPLEVCVCLCVSVPVCVCECIH